MSGLCVFFFLGIINIILKDTDSEIMTQIQKVFLQSQSLTQNSNLQSM